MRNRSVVMPRFMLLYAGHPVIPAREVEARPYQIGRSVITGSSAYADDDDQEYGNRLKLARMGLDPRIHLLAKRMDCRVKPGQSPAMTIEST
jgi:hypothetical protein